MTEHDGHAGDEKKRAARQSDHFKNLPQILPEVGFCAIGDARPVEQVFSG